VLSQLQAQSRTYNGIERAFGMKVAIHTPDKTKYPNLALMKLSSFHKEQKDIVTWYEGLQFKTYDKIYSSKVFSFTKDNDLFGVVSKGGSGNDIKKDLPDYVEHICPDYSLYNLDYSLGFLTRGCIRKCSFCIVPEKEGTIKAHADIEEFLQHDKAVLMDNNVLASEHGVQQIEKIIKLGIKVDFNQGLDARLIDDSIAKLLSKVKWLSPIRLACDSHEQIKSIQKAVTLLRWHNATPRRYFVYCLVRDVSEAIDRIKFLKGLYLEPFAQPFRDFDNNIEPTNEQKILARWVNHTAVFNSVRLEDYLY